MFRADIIPPSSGLKYARRGNDSISLVGVYRNGGNLLTRLNLEEGITNIGINILDYMVSQYTFLIAASTTKKKAEYSRNIGTRILKYNVSPEAKSLCNPEEVSRTSLYPRTDRIHNPNVTCTMENKVVCSETSVSAY
jgi:hypothetical protein